uniref:C2H2-type domain-containing protein n=1 Tax=Arcella intermedia TaxID=1963864 RepID=A0A6B2L8W9_9EUKA
MVFNDNDIMKDHYKSDFHRFNLKRKMGNLPPVAEDLFNKKVEEWNNANEEKSKGSQHLKKNKPKKEKKLTQPKATPEPQEQTKGTIQRQPRTYAPIHSEGQEAEEAEEGEVVEKREEEMLDEKIESAPTLTLKHSLFDKHISPDFPRNIEYMTKTFGFYIPEIDYLKDLPGLIRYLGEKISIGNTCIYCERTFHSLDAVRDHMRAVSHCKILWEDNEGEYEEFYDLEAADARFKVFLAGEEHEDTNAYVSSSNELVLCDKRVALGHRALQHYYKQKPRGTTEIQLMSSLLQEHKRMAAIENQKKSNLDTIAIRKQYAMSLKVGLVNNQQKHFRDKNPL